MRCPDGHDSADPEWCDTCGLAMAPAVPTAGPAAGAAPAGAAGTCPVCGAACDGRFCEECGHDTALPVPARPPAGWTAVVRADPDWFAEVRRRDGPDAAGLAFPGAGPEREVPLTGTQVAIGRHSRSRGTAPEIDLPTDPGVSAQHALLRARPDGGWEVADVGSMNGTAVGAVACEPHVPVPLADGDTIRLGAWTTITLRDRGMAGPTEEARGG